MMTDSLTDSLRTLLIVIQTRAAKNNPIEFRLPRYLIRVMRRHVLTYKKTETMTKTKTNTTKTPFEN